MGMFNTHPEFCDMYLKFSTWKHQWGWLNKSSHISVMAKWPHFFFLHIMVRSEQLSCIFNMAICYKRSIPLNQFSFFFNIFSHQGGTNHKFEGIIDMNNNCCRYLCGKIKPVYPIMSLCRNPSLIFWTRKGSFAFVHVQPSIGDENQ